MAAVVELQVNGEACFRAVGLQGRISIADTPPSSSSPKSTLVGSILRGGTIVVRSSLVSFTSPQHEQLQSKGLVAVMKRGESSFATKYEVALTAGSVAVIIANNDVDNPNSIMTPCGVLKSEKKFKELEIVYPPLIMISYSSSVELRKIIECHQHEKGAMYLSIRPFSHEDLQQDVFMASRGAVLRGCVAYGYEDLVSCLLKHQKLKIALEDIEIGRGATSLHIGIEYGRTSIVAMLLRAGANTECIKNDGFSPLQIAVEQGNMECISLLLCAGAYPDHSHPVGWSSLHTACKTGSLQICKVLVDAGANINYLSMDDCTALHIACLYGHAEIVFYLLKSGVNYRIKNKNGNTALSLAVFTKNFECVNIIKKATTVVPEKPIPWPSHVYFSYPSSRNRPLKKMVASAVIVSSEEIKVGNLGATWLRKLEPIVARVSVQSIKLPLKVVGDCPSLLAIDMDRCCFVEYRSGPRRSVLMQAALALIADGRVIYKQGLLSLLAVLVHVFVSDSALQLSDFDLSIEKIVQMFHVMLYMFEPLKIYYTSSQDTDEPIQKSAAAAIDGFTFSDVFDLSLGLLHFLQPEVFSVLAWRNTHPSLFALPWLSTLLADLRPLKEAAVYWTSLIDIYVEEVLSKQEEVGYGWENDSHLKRVGARLLAAHVTAVLMQYSSELLCSKPSEESVGDDVVDKHFLFSASAPLSNQSSLSLDVIERYPNMDNLLLLFASINNPEDCDEEGGGVFMQSMRFRSVTKAIDVLQIASDAESMLRRVGDSLLTFKSSSNETCSGIGNVWRCLTSSMYVSEIQISALISASELKSCVMIKMYGRFSVVSSVLEGRVAALESYLRQNNRVSVSSLQFRDLQVQGMIAYYRSYAQALCTDAFESRKRHSNVWTGVLAEPPRRKPLFAKPLYDHALGNGIDLMTTIVVIVPFTDSLEECGEIAHAEELAACLVTSGQSHIVILKM